MRCNYREKKYICGNQMDVQIYPVYKKPGVRGKRAKETSDIQKRLNDENAARKLERYLNTNFTNKDIAMHLSYADGFLPEDDEQAKRDIQNYIRRAKRIYAKSGIKNVKYIWVTEKGKKNGRIHHHLIISGGVDRTQLEELWGKGIANSRSLQFTEKGLANLAYYIVKDPVFYKHFNGSRNLDKPIEESNDYKYNRKKATELAEDIDRESTHKLELLYPDYLVSESKAVKNGINGGIYISLRLYKKNINQSKKE
jgi:hypothetical protein